MNKKGIVIASAVAAALALGGCADKKPTMAGGSSYHGNSGKMGGSSCKGNGCKSNSCSGKMGGSSCKGNSCSSK